MVRRAQILGLSVLSLTLLGLAARAIEVPDYKLGDTATNDVITPVPLKVLNAAATETLKTREASRVPLVFRFNTNAASEAVLALREAFYSARTNFEDSLYRTMKGKPENERVIGSVLFDQAVMSAKSRTANFPLLEQLAPVWARNESDEATEMILIRQLRELMSRPIVAGRPDDFNSKNSVRLVDVDMIEESFTARDAEERGRIVLGTQVLRIVDARNMARTNILPQFQIAGGFLASFVRSNAMEDVALTRAMRAQRTAGLAVMDTYDAGQPVVKRGQPIDARMFAALAALREQGAVAALQTKLEVQKVQASAPVTRETSYLPWIIGGFGLIVVLLLLILRRVRATQSMLPVLVRGDAGLSEGEVAWRERALIAEANVEQAKQAMKSGFMQWMREKLVSGLFRQRAELLSSQEKAAAEMRALDERLEQLHAPLQERIATYETRIVELEKELAAKGAENRELIKAKITLAKHQLSVERERDRRFGTN